MKRSPWLSFIVLYIVACMVGFSQMKVPPLMGDLIGKYGLSITQAGLLMTAFTLAGIILALPSAPIVMKIGLKKTGPILMLCLIIGNLLGAFAPNFTVLLLSRAIEGIAFAFMILYGSMLIPQWFPPQKIGMAMGMFVTFPAIAPLVMFRISGSIAAQYGMTSIWIGLAILSAISLVLCMMFLEVPDASGEGPADGPQISMFAGFTSQKAWLLAITQGAVAFILFTFLFMCPAILMGYYGMDVGRANNLSSYMGLFGIVSCVLSGYLISKTGRPDLINIFSMGGLAIVCFLTFSLGDATFLVYIFALSMLTGFVIPSVLTLAAQSARSPAEIGTTIAMINFIYYIGVAVGAPVVSKAAQDGANWTGALMPLVAVPALGCIAAILFKMSKNRN